MLIGLGEVDLLADCVLEELAALIQRAFGHISSSGMGIARHAWNTSS